MHDGIDKSNVPGFLDSNSKMNNSCNGNYARIHAMVCIIRRILKGIKYYIKINAKGNQRYRKTRM
jgi:hypothetical protein